MLLGCMGTTNGLLQNLLWVNFKLIMDYVVFCLISLKVELLFASKEALCIESSYMTCDAQSPKHSSGL